MTWLAWRQFRAQALTGAIGLALLCGLFLLTGQGMADRYAEGLAVCGNDCRDFYDQFTDQHQGRILAVTALVLAVPALLGLFWGAPLVARELDAGTHRLAWNQSVTRTRWLTVKLLMVGLATAAAAGVVTWAVSWWSDPLEAASRQEPRLPMQMLFSASGVAPVAYALFAFALGVAVGMLVRRALPAMAITLAVFAVVQVVVPAIVRPYLAPIVTTTAVIAPENLDQLTLGPNNTTRIVARSPEPGSWMLSNHTVDSSGRKVDTIPLSPQDAACGSGQGIEVCLAEIERLGYRQAFRHHPPSQFWQLQWTEAGLYGGLTLGLVGFSYWWLRRRVA